MTYKLQDTWTIWTHKAKDSNWSPSSYTQLAHFDTIETFGSYFNFFNQSVFEEKMIFIMKYPIKPIWEDPNACNGGYWSFKIPNTSIIEVLKKIVLYIVIGKLDKNYDKKHIIGVSTSPKKGFHIIKIWNNNCHKNDISNINCEPLDMAQSDIIYTPFKKK